MKSTGYLLLGSSCVAILVFVLFFGLGQLYRPYTDIHLYDAYLVVPTLWIIIYMILSFSVLLSGMAKLFLKGSQPVISRIFFIVLGLWGMCSTYLVWIFFDNN